MRITRRIPQVGSEGYEPLFLLLPTQYIRAYDDISFGIQKTSGVSWISINCTTVLCILPLPFKAHIGIL